MEKHKNSGRVARWPTGGRKVELGEWIEDRFDRSMDEPISCISGILESVQPERWEV